MSQQTWTLSYLVWSESSELAMAIRLAVQRMRTGLQVCPSPSETMDVFSCIAMPDAQPRRLLRQSA